MADASFLQPSFLGGEWAPYSQGRADKPEYRTALNVCRNSIPLEEGAVTRRPGFTNGGTTRNGAAGALKAFNFDQSHPYTFELTDGHMRLRSGLALATELTQSVQSVSGAVVTIPSHGYAVSDQVLFSLGSPAVGSYAGIAPLLGHKQFTITARTTDTITVQDAVTGTALSGVTIGDNAIRVAKIIDFATPYTLGSWANTRLVQDETVAYLLHPTVAPYVLQSTTPEATSATGFATFSFGAATFVDGPYLDPPTDGTFLTPGSLSGTITLTETGTYYSFLSTDVGRQIRLFSEPGFWASGTAYAVGDVVKFDNSYWSALQASTGVQPDTDLTKWAIDPSAAIWTWGTIASVVNPSQITVTLAAADPNKTFAGGPLLYSQPIRTWRLGAYSGTTGYPTCGTFHEGRLWLAGTAGNRIDSTMSNEAFRFSPTLLDGTVADNCGISAIFRAKDINIPYWIIPDGSGLIVGTQAGEWNVRASSLNDPLTPTSIQAHRVTNFGSDNVEPVALPLARAFVQRNGRKLIEYTTAWLSSDNPFQGDNIALRAKHLWASGCEEIAYQREKTPIIWARMSDGSLAGCTYRRDSPFSNQPAAFAGWHKHTHAAGRTFTSIQVGPAIGGLTDALSAITYDATAGIHYVELMTDVFEEDDTIQNAYFVDGIATPEGADLVISGGITYVRVYGLDYVNGETVTAWVAGVDAGDYVVSGGMVSIPVDQAGSLLTTTLLKSFTPTTLKYGVFLYQAGTFSFLAQPNNTPKLSNVGFSLIEQGPSVDVWGNFWSTSITGGSGFGGETQVIAPSGGVLQAYGRDTIWGLINAYAVAHQPLGGSSWHDISSSPTFDLGYGTAVFTWGGDSKLVVFQNKMYDYTFAYSYFVLAVFDINYDGSLTCAGVTWSPSTNTPTNFQAHLGMLDLAGQKTFNDNIVVILGDGALSDFPRLMVYPPINVLRGKTEAVSQTLYTFDTGVVGTSNGLGLTTSITGTNARGTTPAAFCMPSQAHGTDVFMYFSKACMSISSVAWVVTLAGTYPNGILSKFTLPTTGWTFTTGTPGNTTSATLSPAVVTNGFTTALGAQYNAFTDIGKNFDGTSGSLVNSDYFAAPQIIEALGGGFIVGWYKPWTADNSYISGQNWQFKEELRVQSYDPSTATFTDITTLSGATAYLNGIGGGTTGSGTDYIDLSAWMLYKDTNNFIQIWHLDGAAATGSGRYYTWRTQLAQEIPASFTFPASIGFTYTSDVQVLRAIAPQEAGAQNGPALGKIRRTHQFSALMHGTQGVSFGTDFTHLNAAQLQSPGGVPYTKAQLFSGVHWDGLGDDYSFDSMLCWRTTRPYPTTVLAIEQFIHTQDR